MALLRAIGASGRPGDRLGARSRRCSSVWSRRSSASSPASCSRPAQGAALGASASTSRPSGDRPQAGHGHHLARRRHGRHRSCRRCVPRPARRARPADRRDARGRGRAALALAGAGSSSASSSSVLGIAALLPGLFGERRPPVRRARRVPDLHRRLRARPGDRPPARAWSSVRRCRSCTASPGTLARQNAMRNPKRTSATAAALMIGVALVAFITVFAASAKASINTAIDKAMKADYVISTGGFGSFDAGFSGTLAEEVADLPEVGASTPLRFNEAEIDGSGQFFAAFDPSTVDRAVRPRPHRRLDGATSPTAASPSRVRRQRTRSCASGPTSRSASRAARPPSRSSPSTARAQGGAERLRDVDRHLQRALHDQLDQQVYVKLADGVSADQGRARRSSSVIKPYPNAELQDQSEFKAGAGRPDQPAPEPDLRAALAGRRHRPHRHREHAGAVDLRAHRELGLLRAVGMTPRPAAVERCDGNR